MTQQIYYNGPIITMESETPVEAIFIEDGIIKKIGPSADILALQTEHTTLIDLKGHTLLPAFIDSHSHITAFANTLLVVSLHKAKSFNQLQDVLQTAKATKKPGEWIIGFGYDHNFFEEHEHPTKDVLDAVCPEHPVIITHESGHMGVLNSLALNELQINAQTKNPEGGVIGRLPNSNEPNGYIEEKAFMTYASQVPRPSFDAVVAAMTQAQDIYLSHGITTCQDGYTKESEFELLKVVSDMQKLKMDVICYIDLKDHEALLTSNLQRKDYINHLKIGGYKLFLDGSPQGRTAWMSSPYENDSDAYCGYPIYQDDTELASLIKIALDQKKQVITHCNGDAAAEQYISVFTDVLKSDAYSDSYRPVMIHAQLVRPDQLPRMKAISMIPSFFIAHTYYWGDIHVKNFGLNRASVISPAKTALDLNIPYTFHQDTPVIQPNMLETIWCAVNRLTKNGVVLGEEQQLSPYDALKGITIHAANQYFEEHQKGSIKEGKIADLVILSDNPLTVDSMKIKDIKVLQTIKNGTVLYQA